MTLTVGSLFAGIGGFDFGFEQAGMKTLWQIEMNDFCRSILERHFPDAQRFSKIEEVGEHNLDRVDVLAGGFPCPVVSTATHGRNTGPWLWPEFARIIGEIRPRYVVVENVTGLISKSERFGEVLGDLAARGYDAEWRVLRASDFGAPHKRARVWVVAYPHSDSQSDGIINDEAPVLPQLRDGLWRWSYRPRNLGVDDGLSNRVDRAPLRALGNALIPAIAEWIGHRIVADSKTRLTLSSDCC